MDAACSSMDMKANEKNKNELVKNYLFGSFEGKLSLALHNFGTDDTPDTVEIGEPQVC